MKRKTTTLSYLRVFGTTSYSTMAMAPSHKAFSPFNFPWCSSALAHTSNTYCNFCQLAIASHRCASRKLQKARMRHPLSNYSMNHTSRFRNADIRSPRLWNAGQTLTLHIDEKNRQRPPLIMRCQRLFLFLQPQTKRFIYLPPTTNALRIILSNRSISARFRNLHFLFTCHRHSTRSYTDA